MDRGRRGRLTFDGELSGFGEEMEEDLAGLNEEVGCRVLDRSVPPGALEGEQDYYGDLSHSRKCSRKGGNIAVLAAKSTTDHSNR